MSKFTLSLTLLTLLCVFSARSSNSGIPPIEIDSVRVVAEVTREQRPSIAVGSHSSVIQREEIERNITRSLSELLLEGSSIQIKSMGQGALSTASFRGTASSHTKVLWNGIPINSAQLGSFDFSQVPVYFVDNVSLFHGGSVAEVGSGAIGGSVSFTNSERPVERPELSIITEAASNDTYSAGMNYRFTRGRLTSVTRGFYQQSDNDYRYLNKVYSKDTFEERRQNADYKMGGVMQELYYKRDNGDKLSLVGWLQMDNRSIPQNIISTTVFNEQTQGTNLRLTSSYKLSREDHHIDANVAYLYGDLDYEKNMNDFSQTQTTNTNHTILAKSAYRYSGLDKLSLGADLSYRYDKVISDNYAQGRIDRSTISARAYALYRLSKRLHIDGQATLEKVDSRSYGIYSLTAKYFAIEKYLTLKASNSYNLRVPTLNDLYWSPGGNPELLPETGRSWDLTAQTKPTLGAVEFDISLSAYYMDVDNWIMWTPSGNGSIWSPVNFKNVLSRGLETNASAKAKWGKTTHSISFNHTFAHSTDNSGNTMTQGKQLIYIPLNRWSAAYKLWFKDRAWLSYNTSFTDVRYTADDESYMTNAYYLHSAELGYVIKLEKERKISLSLKCENIFDAYYESTEFFPMPLRMFWGRVIFNL